jgi:hypothetical protein
MASLREVNPAMRVDLIPEPELVFGDGKRCIDPKVGLISYGPCGLRKDQPRVVNAGVIGTRDGISYLMNFLQNIRQRISCSDGSSADPWKCDFPGLGIRSILRFDVEIEQDNIELITNEDVSDITRPNDRKKRIELAAQLYERKFQDLASTAHPVPDLVFIPLPERVVESCKDPGYEGNRIVYARRTMEKASALQQVPLFDFHNLLKVLGFPHKMRTQVIQPTTLRLTEGPQDPATIAWNFSVAMFYKATGNPWKIADLDEDTCYVGISFYEEIGEQGPQMRASMAHVYLRTGESQIIRGKPFRWDGARGSSPQLSATHARDILSEVIQLFERQKQRKPVRVVVHKTSPFTDDEIAGFSDASKDAKYVDLVHVMQHQPIRLYHKDSVYSPLRGTLISDATQPRFLLYTSGFIQALGTYPGSTVAEPLICDCSKLETDIYQVSKDVMSLTKLDWNNSDFCTRLPVTISVSRTVGSILAESRARNIDPPSSYSNFM